MIMKIIVLTWLVFTIVGIVYGIWDMYQRRYHLGGDRGFAYDSEHLAEGWVAGMVIGAAASLITGSIAFLLS